MKFRVIGSSVILEPSVKEVEESYLERPDIYEPVDEGSNGKDPDIADKGEEPSFGDLKAQATELGLDFKGNISKAALKELIEEAMSGVDD